MQTQTRPSVPAFSREELFSLSHRLRRRFMIDLLLAPVLLFGATVLIGMAAHVPSETTLIAIVFVMLGSPIVAGVAAALRVWRRSPQCPGCGVGLVASSGQLRLRGDVCARCGTTVVGRGEAAPPALPLHAEFLARYNALARPYWRWKWISIGTLVVGGAGVYALEHGWLPRSFEPLVMGMALMFVVTGLLAFLKVTRWAIRSAGLNCPTCADPLIGGRAGVLTRQTLSTGRCPWCSAAVWQ